MFSTVFDGMFMLVQSQASSITITLHQDFVICPSQAFHMKKNSTLNGTIKFQIAQYCFKDCIFLLLLPETKRVYPVSLLLSSVFTLLGCRGGTRGTRGYNPICAA